MKVQFLLKDAWSSDCCIDNSLQVSLSLSLFFFWSSEAGTGAAQEDMTVNAHPSSSLLPSGVKQPFWLMEEMNHYSTWG